MDKKKNTEKRKSSPARANIKQEGTHEAIQEESDIRQAILAFKVLNEEETKDVTNLSPEELTQKLAAKHNFTDSQHNLKSAALLDFYVAAVLWARDRKFNEKQLSSFYTALHMLLTNIQERGLSMEENIAELKKFLAGVGVDNPHSSQCGGLDVFSFPQATEVVDYISSTLFQHYKLYQYLFTEEKAAEVVELQKAVEVPEKLGASVPWPAPLSEAIPEELYTRYVAPPPPPTQPGRTRELTHGSQTMASMVTGVSGFSGQSGAPPSIPPGSPEKSALGTIHEPSAAAGGEPVSGAVVGGPSIAPASSAQPPVATTTATAGEGMPTAEQINMFSRISPQVIRQMVSEVSAELVRGLETDVANKLREKENVLLTRINKVHNVAPASNVPVAPTHK